MAFSRDMRVISKRDWEGCFESWGRASALVPLVLALLTGCKGLEGGEDLSVGASFSALPNIGLSLSAAQVRERDEERTWAFELEGTHQSVGR